MNLIRMRLRLLFAIAVITAWLILPISAVAGTPLDEALGQYNKGQYAQALSLFQALEKTNPESDIVHYYMALCHQSLRQMRQAKSEYDWVVEHSTSATLKENAEKGSRSLERYCAQSPTNRNDSRRSSAVNLAGVSPNSFFLTQVNDPKWNRNGPRNSLDCGPTCLAMVFRRFNKFPPGVNANDSARLIQTTRFLMTGSLKDETTTNLQIESAAKAVSLNTAFIRKLDDIDSALSEGKLVIAVGCPFQQSSYGPRVGYRPFDNGHFILLTNKAQGQFVANDPYYVQGPVSLSSGELESFLSFFPKSKKTCVAIWP